MGWVAAIGAFGGLGGGGGAGVKHQLNLVSTFVCVYTLGSFLSLFLYDHHGQSTTTSPTTSRKLKTARHGFP